MEQGRRIRGFAVILLVIVAVLVGVAALSVHDNSVTGHVPKTHAVDADEQTGSDGGITRPPRIPGTIER